MTKVEFIDFNNTSAWVRGKHESGYIFDAKLFDEGSSFGIKNGRVSKLCIFKVENPMNYIVNYDRGWDRKPRTPEQREIFNDILNFLENSPKRFF